MDIFDNPETMRLPIEEAEMEVIRQGNSIPRVEIKIGPYTKCINEFTHTELCFIVEIMNDEINEFRTRLHELEYGEHGYYMKGDK